PAWFGRIDRSLDSLPGGRRLLRLRGRGDAGATLERVRRGPRTHERRRRVGLLRWYVLCYNTLLNLFLHQPEAPARESPRWRFGLVRAKVFRNAQTTNVYFPWHGHFHRHPDGRL